MNTTQTWITDIVTELAGSSTIRTLGILINSSREKMFYSILLHLQDSTPNVKWGPTQLLLSQSVWSSTINFLATTTDWIKHENSYPWPSSSTNISWYGNCRLRSFRISSTHLGSPSCAARCAYKFFFLSNSKFPPHKYSHARGRTDVGMPFLQRSRTCTKEWTQCWFWGFHGSRCSNEGHPLGCHTM